MTNPVLRLEEYRPFVGDEVIAEIYRRARRYYGRNILHVNSTYQGGGVAEILTSLIPLMNTTGIHTDWRILHGTPDFFNVTKKFHNALQGGTIRLSPIKKRLYTQTNEQMSVFAQIFHDAVIVHDPQPLPLVQFYHKSQPWIWHCHVDLSNPNPQLWEYLKDFILRYDCVVISSESYRRPDLPVEQRVIMPAIDPLSSKNKDLTPQLIQRTFRKFDIPTDRPYLLQVARFDRWKDPEGAIEVWKRVRSEVNCRLVLCGSMAADDPEGWSIYERIRRRAARWLESRDVVLITTENNILVNALQRMAAVVLQKSLREGFGLAVTEAMWKGKPVVASDVGGIRLQIEDGINGYLVAPRDYDGFARRIIRVLQDPELRRHLGENARASVRRKFLITRFVMDYLDLLCEMWS